MSRPWIPRAERLLLLVRLGLRPARRRLSLLQLLLLLCVPLLQSLRLLLVLLFNLLLFRVIRFLLPKALMILVLLLLQFLSFLILLLLQLLLLLLIFLIQLRIPGVGCSGARRRRKVFRVNHAGRRAAISSAALSAPLIVSPIRGRVVCASSFSRGHGFAPTEFSRLGGRGNRRLAVILRRPQFPVRARSLYLPNLGCGRRNVSLASCILFFRRRTPRDPALASVVAHPIRVIDHSLVVNVVNDSHVHVADGPVVEKVAIIPASAGKTFPEIPEAVVDASIEAHMRPPKTFVEKKHAAVPSPPRRCP